MIVVAIRTLIKFQFEYWISALQFLYCQLLMDKSMSLPRVTSTIGVLTNPVGQV